jgi:acetoin utilization protein AcuB
MLVNDCMTRHPILISPRMPAAEAQQIMAENNIRHLPVVGSGKKLLGLITRQCLTIKPDALASLNVWEISRYLANMTVERVMVRAENVQTISPDRTVERAAKVMTEHKIGCLPVIEDEVVAGILTETDLLRAFQEMLGIRSEGIRVTVRVPDRKGEFAKVFGVVAAHSWGIMGVGSFPARRAPGYYDMVLKITEVAVDEVVAALAATPEQEIVDVRAAV